MVNIRRLSRRGRAVGISLVEVCGATAVLGVVTAAALAMVPSWLDGARQSATTTSLVSILKDTQQRAASEGRPMCVDLDLAAQTWSVLRGACESGRDGVTFLADGSATPGTFRLGPDTVTVSSSGSVTFG